MSLSQFSRGKLIKSMPKTPCVYILASQRNGTLYIGVTSNLGARAEQHASGLVEGFTKRYNVKDLVYFEFHTSMIEAITREKQLKAWKRAWKIRLIESVNPDWQSLLSEIPFDV